ncbi:acyltransferase family protein [Pseudomonas sp. 2835]|uniref:acyltransferase family protein n=1 Tax=Pseudomonas sp. 2835 TaxID=3156451 RepID=UPI003D2376B8
MEEQFYFLWPAILIVALRFCKGRVLWLPVLLIILSFASAQYAIAKGWSGVYFLIYSRAGELLLGAALAMLRGPQIQPDRLKASVLSGAGLVLIFGAALTLTKSAEFPGINALWPCLGAASVIASSWYGRHPLGQILACKPMVFIGLISYSVYLWHWPILSYLRYLSVDIDFVVGSSVVLLAIVMAYLSYRWVETPFRNVSAYTKRGWGVAGTALVVVLAGPLVIYVMGGIPQRFPYAVMTKDDLLKERDRYWVSSKNLSGEVAGANKKVMIVGNSHAIDLHYALRENGIQANTLLVPTTNKCFDFGFNSLADNFDNLCRERFSAVVAAVKKYAPDVIYLHDNWSRVDLPELTKALAAIRSETTVPLYVFGPKNIFRDSALNISRFAWEQRMTTPAQINSFAQQYNFQRQMDFDSKLKLFFQDGNLTPGVSYVSMMDVQCGQPRRCEIVSEKTGDFLYFDSEHLTLRGAKEVGQYLRKERADLF